MANVITFKLNPSKMLRMASYFSQQTRSEMHKIMKKNGKDAQLNSNLVNLNGSTEFRMDEEMSGPLLAQALCTYEKLIFDLANLIGEALKKDKDLSRTQLAAMFAPKTDLKLSNDLFSKKPGDGKTDLTELKNEMIDYVTIIFAEVNREPLNIYDMTHTEFQQHLSDEKDKAKLAKKRQGEQIIDNSTGGVKPKRPKRHGDEDDNDVIDDTGLEADSEEACSKRKKAKGVREGSNGRQPDLGSVAYETPKNKHGVHPMFGKTGKQVTDPKPDIHNLLSEANTNMATIMKQYTAGTNNSMSVEDELKIINAKQKLVDSQLRLQGKM
jgi:hypothetical protein